MRILMLAHLFAHNTANTYRYRTLCEYFSAKGYEIDVIGYKKYSSEVELPEGVTYFSILDVFKIQNLWALSWLTLVEFGKIVLKWRAYTYVRSGMLNGAIKLILKRLLSSKHYNLIIVSVVPWTYYSFLSFLKKYSPVILDVSDPLYKNAFLDQKQLGFPGSKKLEQKVFGMADKIILMSEPLIGMYQKELLIDACKMKFITPSICLPSDYALKQNVYDFTRSEPLKLLYAGTIYPGYRDLLEFLKGVMLVDGYEIEIISRLKEKSTSRVTYTDWLNKEELKKKYQECDLLVFIDNFYGYQVPSKIFELLACRKPILFIYDCRNPYLYRLLKNQKGIFFVKNEAAEIEEMLLYIREQDKITVEYNIDLSVYSDKTMCQNFEKCILDIVNDVN